MPRAWSTRSPAPRWSSSSSSPASTPAPNPRWAATAALALGLGTFLWVYAESYWTEPLCLLALFAGLLALRRDAEGTGSTALGILGGALLGAAALFRYEASAIGAVLLAVACVRLARRRGPRALVGPLSGWAAGIAVLAGWNWHRFGNALVTGNPHGHLRTLVGGHVLGRLAFSIPANLASPEQGLLVFAPPVAVALWITARAWRRLDVWERTGILFSAGLLVFYSAFVLWQTDDAWGPRFLVLVLPFVLLPVLRHGSRAARRWFVGAAILGAAVQVAGVLTVITNATIMWLMDWPQQTRLGWFFRSEILKAWARLAHHGVDAFWWSRSPGGLVAAAVLGATALGAAMALFTALRRPATASPAAR